MKSTTQDIKEIRLKNLLNLIKQEGSQIAFSRKVDIDSSHISQIKNPNNKKNLGEKLARKIESALNLPTGWMDKDHDNNEPPSKQVEALELDNIEQELLSLLQNQDLEQKAMILEVTKTLLKSKTD